jgi:predicted RNA-binding protein with PIN domain
MIIIIDGYNVLKNVYQSMVDARHREIFIHQLNAYAEKKGHTFLLVFDGGPFSYPYKESHQNVTLVFSGGAQTADDYIMNYILTHARSNMLLISTDRALNRFALQQQVTSLDALAFYRIMQETLAKKPVQLKDRQLHKMTEEKNTELDRLMEESTAKIPHKQEDLQEKKKEQMKERLSKKERVLRNKLKKL